jgi:hypothetical protein
MATPTPNDVDAKLIDAIGSPHAPLIAAAISVRAQKVFVASNLENLERAFPRLAREMFSNDPRATAMWAENLGDQAVARTQLDLLLISEATALENLALHGIVV